MHLPRWLISGPNPLQLHVTVANLREHTSKSQGDLLRALVRHVVSLQGAEEISASWLDPDEPSLGREKLSRSHRKFQTDSVERSMKLLNHAGPNIMSACVSGAENSKPPKGEHFWSNRWQVFLGTDHSMSEDGVYSYGVLSGVISVSIRYEYVVRQSDVGWREFANNIIATISGYCQHGSGIVEISRASTRDYGVSFTGLAYDDGFDRQTQWLRWCLSVMRGIEKIPWPSQGVILSPAALARVGGLNNLKKEMLASLRVPLGFGDSPLVESTPCKGAVLWLSPNYRRFLPESGDSKMGCCDDADRAARMYMRLQELGVAW